MTQRQNILSGLAVLVFLLIASIIVVTLGVNWRLSGSRSKNWPQIDGQLIKIDFLGAVGRGNRIIVKYQYVFNGTSYYGNEISFGDVSGKEMELRALHNGDNVKVSVNPKNPTESVLMPGVTSGAKVITLFGSFILLVVFFAAITLWKTFVGDKSRLASV